MSLSHIGRASDIRLFIEYYKSFIFSLPKTSYLAILMVAVISIFIIIAPLDPWTYITLFTILTHTVVLYTIQRKLMPVRRLMGFVVFAMGSSVFIRALSTLLGLPIIFSTNIIAILTSINLLYTVSRGCGLGGGKTLVVGFVCAGSLLVVFTIAPLATIIGMSSILLLSIIFRYLNILGLNILKTEGIKAISGFVRLILANEVEPLESILSSIGIDKRIEFRFLLFRNIADNNPKAVIAIPGLHPGPFRSIGSSRISNMLIEEFERYGVACVVLHSASSHELDATNSRQVKNIIMDSVNRVLSLSRGIRISPPFRLDYDDFTSFNLVIDDVVYSMISRISHGMDDISYKVQERVLHDVGNVVIIDSHSSYVDNHNPVLELDSDLYIKMKHMLRNVLQISGTMRKYDIVDVGCSRLRVSDKGNYELGSGGIVAMVLRFNGDSFSIFSFDSNNILLHTRKRLAERLMKEFNLNDIEITTTDTHSIVGVRAKEEYSVLGRRMKIEELYKLSREVLSRSLGQMSRCSVEEHIIESCLRVLGEEGLEKLRMFVSRSVRVIKPLIIIIFAFPLLPLLFR